MVQLTKMILLNTINGNNIWLNKAILFEIYFYAQDVSRLERNLSVSRRE